MLQTHELTRYSRNILLEGVGRRGQEKLKSSKIGIVGMGGLGSPSAFYLASAGVGEIHLIDFDTIDLTNLQRQILYKEADINKNKAEVSKKRLLELNPNLKIVSHTGMLQSGNIFEILGTMDLILEGSDNFETKFLVNDFAYLEKIPLIIAGILRFEGQIMGVDSETSCYRCTFPEPPNPLLVPNCAEAGVLGSVAGVLGSMQASEALKFLIFGGSELFGKILQCDLMNMEFRKIRRKKNPNCPLCGEKKIYTDLNHHNNNTRQCAI